jgi:hypothetical protein
VLHFELLVHFFLSPLILLGKVSDGDDILLDRWIQLFLEDCEDISRANEAISISVIKHKGYEVTLSNVHSCKLFPQFLKLLEVEVRPNLEKIQKPLGKVIPYH